MGVKRERNPAARPSKKEEGNMRGEGQENKDKNRKGELFIP